MVVLTVTKPSQPTPDDLLFAHNNGQWAQKIKARLHYFGPWADPQGALTHYLGHDTPGVNRASCPGVATQSTASRSAGQAKQGLPTLRPGVRPVGQKGAGRQPILWFVG